MRFTRTAIVVPLVAAGVLAGCSGDSDTSSGGSGAGGGGGNGGTPDPTPLPPLESANLTTDATIKALHAVASPATPRDPRVVDDVEALLDDGFGDTAKGPAWAVVETTLDGSDPPAVGPKPRLLTRFMHLADAQLADDESPVRLASFDAPGASNAAFRTQEAHGCRILNAAVRTINALHKKTPFEFVLLGGDNADNAQTNELDWFLNILDGSGRVECDSGHDDDPDAGPDNDPKDAFVAEGLDIPWYWVTGNHDVCNQGNFPNEGKAADAIGGTAFGGTRVWSKRGGPVEDGEVPADERRAVVTRKSMLEQIAAAGDSHGIGPDVVKYGKAYYSFDAVDSPIRFIVLDSAAETGASDGVIHRADLDDFIKPALDEARDAGKIVVLTSHHIGISDGTGLGGTLQRDAVTQEEWVDLVGGYDNVIMHLAGHTHVHRVSKVEPAGKHAYWGLETAAIADYPNQMRFIEIWDQDNGFFSIRAVGVDFQTTGDVVAADGRRRAVTDYTSGWGPDGLGEPDQRNVNLWIAKPPGL